MTEEKGKPVKAAFPKVRLVIGDLDSSEILEDEASKADVVIRRLHASLRILQNLTLSQIQQMLRTMSPQQKPLPKASHLVTRKRSRVSGCILAVPAFCAGKPCAMITDLESTLIACTMTGPRFKT